MENRIEHKTGTINVSKKIIAHVAEGIYKNPANAIKELVSNAFDACATWVKITTNIPYFNFITCEDNGGGIGLEDFENILDQIGSSGKRMNKREYADCENFERPIIGKIGIGLLSVAQICDKFTVISKRKGDDIFFEATIGLQQFKEESYILNKKIALGKYDLYINSASEEDIPISYTKIIMTSLKQGFQDDLRQKERVIKPEEMISKVLDISEFIEPLASKDFRSISIYDNMIWELGLLCPIKYISRNDIIFPSTKYIQNDIERLINYNFRLFVDGLEVYKPILFQKKKGLENEGEDFKIYTLPEFDDLVGGEQLKFHGYIYSQKSGIKPNGLQGILIRIKDVTIGNYDRNILRYPSEEGPIFGMISGEVFIEKGLENALNIDRNSFNETHPHYQKLQSKLHEFVKKHVFNDIRERSEKRLAKQKAVRINQDLNRLTEKIRQKWDMELEFEINEKDYNQPYVFDKDKMKLSFFVKSKGWAKSEKERFYQMKSIANIILIEHSLGKISTEELISNILLGQK